MGKFRRRGQITIFIILGIIILFSSAAYFYVRDKTTALQPNTIETKKTTALHPYVEACLELKVREALNLVGMTGGYINYPLAIQTDPASYLKVAPIAEAKMPYWAGDRIPPLDFIKSEIENYTITHIDECINNFSEIKGYDITPIGNIDVRLTFADNEVDAEMRYPLRAVKVPEQNEFSLNDYDFFIKIPIHFKSVYDVAKKIMDDENKNFFMEKFTMDLISLDDNGDKQPSTPLMNMDFTTRQPKWTLTSVRTELKSLLNTNLQYIKFGGTEYTQLPDIFPYQYLRNHNVWNFDQNAINVQEPSYPGIKVGLSYDSNWKPFRLDVSPTQGPLLKSGQTLMTGALSFIGVQIWHFTYDLSYPVVVTIKDENSKTSEPYFFSYAFLVSIHNNQPQRQTFGSSIFTTDETPSEEEVCDYLKETGSYITVLTYNNYTNQPRNGVNITFTCGRYTCPLGETDWSTGTVSGAVAELKTTFPRCAWGILRGYREGYENSQMFMSSEQDKTVSIYLKPVIEFNDYTITKQFYDERNSAARRLGQESNLSDDEQAIVILKSADMADQYLTLPINTSDEITSLKFYKNADSKYNITIYLFKQGTTEDDSQLLGAYESEFSIDEKTLEESNSIKFHVIEYNSKDEEDLGIFLMSLRSFSTQISKPEFIKN